MLLVFYQIGLRSVQVVTTINNLVSGASWRASFDWATISRLPFFLSTTWFHLKLSTKCSVSSFHSFHHIGRFLLFLLRSSLSLSRFCLVLVFIIVISGHDVTFNYLENQLADCYFFERQLTSNGIKRRKSYNFFSRRRRRRRGLKYLFFLQLLLDVKKCEKFRSEYRPLIFPLFVLKHSHKKKLNRHKIKDISSLWHAAPSIQSIQTDNMQNKKTIHQFEFSQKNGATLP